MKLLVTGGAGFIGSNFIRYWMKKYSDDEIVNFDALTYAGNLENLKEVEDNPKYRFVKGDIRNKELLLNTLLGADIIVHFAAETHVDRSILGPEAFVETNVKGTFVLLEAAREMNIRFHHVSTDEVFGTLNLDNHDKFSETTAYAPRSPYSASKAASDHLVRAYATTYGLKVTISNTSNNFGPFMFPEKFIPLAITNILEGKQIPIYGEGNQIRDWLYVEDHCRAIDLIINKGRMGETYLVGGNTDDIPNIEIARMILREMGRGEEMIKYVTDRPGHDVRYAIDWTKAKNELGYEPLCSFEEYLLKTINWYKDNTEWWKRVKSGDYQNYYQQQYGDR